MLKWEDIEKKVEEHKLDFRRTYKCVNKSNPPKGSIREIHLDNLIKEYNSVINILFLNFKNFTKEHKTKAYEIHSEFRDYLQRAFFRLKVRVKIPTDLGTIVDKNILEEDLDFDFSEEEKINDNKLDTVDTKNIDKMPQTKVEFLNTASKLIPDFDGKTENLQSFLDSLNLVDSIQETHEQVAVELVKTKLKGTARNLISNESSLQQIIAKLKTSVKGESVEVLAAKLMNVKQNNKSANIYAKEIEDLAKSLTNAYISDGLTIELAEKYSTQTAVRAITKNATNEKVKIVMESGQFTNMNEAVAKFVNSCTEVFGQSNAILHFNRNNNYNNNQANWNRGYAFGRGQNRKAYRGRGRGSFQNNTRYRANNRSNQGNIRYTNDVQNSENPNRPLNTQNSQ